MSALDPVSLELVRILAHTARGPRREGVYALWLAVRVAQDLLLVPPPTERAHRRRVVALEHRLASLTLPPQLRRALAAAPSRDGAGAEIGDAIAGAARAARERIKSLKAGKHA